MASGSTSGPESTAERVALWRALHLLVDASPHVLEDNVGLELVGPDEGWRGRPDMDPDGTSLFRASIVARARFVEDVVTDAARRGMRQYVILGAGLDTFAQRRPAGAEGLQIFEVDQPSPQEWKRHRLVELGYGMPTWLRLVPVDFEAGGDWLERLSAEGFDAKLPAIVASTGVSMYLTREAIAGMLRQVASLAEGTTFLMTFLLPPEQMSTELRPGFEVSQRGAKASGTPFISFFLPEELLGMARDAGFKDARHVTAAALAHRYFANRSDSFRPAPNSEEWLVATT